MSKRVRFCTYCNPEYRERNIYCCTLYCRDGFIKYLLLFVALYVFIFIERNFIHISRFLFAVLIVVTVRHLVLCYSVSWQGARLLSYFFLCVPTCSSSRLPDCFPFVKT